MVAVVFELLLVILNRNSTRSLLEAFVKFVNDVLVLRLRTSLVRAKFAFVGPVTVTLTVAVSEIVPALVEVACAKLVQVLVPVGKPEEFSVAVKLTLWLLPGDIVPKLNVVEPEFRVKLFGSVSVTWTFWAEPVPLDVTWIWN